ncbi:MAG: hypothetical protein JW996_00035 [Candidatus Cloacimonetes bacterium]|nr:hypothetical protein [Candidatus Cloacimonadota bacterium]
MKEIEILPRTIKKHPIRKRILGCQKGFSLIEAVGALPLAALVLVISTLAIANFVTAFEENKLYIQMQDELFTAMEYIRYGYPLKNVTYSNLSDDGMIGLMTAKNVSIPPDGNSITIYPRHVSQGANESNYWLKYYLDPNGNLIARGQYRERIFNSIVFPSGNMSISDKKRFRIIDINFRLSQEQSLQDKFVYYTIKAEVRFRQKKSDESLAEDLKKNTRTIEYSSGCFLANYKGQEN